MFASQTAPVHERGAAIYSRAVLGFYDTLVVKISNSWIWRSPSKIMLDLYHHLISDDHLDIGPGTGWYLAHTHLSKLNTLSLLDLNQNSLDVTARRLVRAGTIPAEQLHTHTGNILDAATLPHHQFSSVSANYLLHCLPSDPAMRNTAMTNIAGLLTDDGVFFGSTVLGDSAGHNLAGRGLMNLYNRLNIFDNRTDNAQTVRNLISQHFHRVDRFTVSGTVVTFVASHPRR